MNAVKSHIDKDADASCVCTLSPAERRREKIRDSIIAAAQGIFAKEGESAVSMRRLAEAIDYSPAALYKYFASKEDLFDAVREVFFERLLKHMNQARCSGGDLRTMFEACGRAYIETALDQPSTFIMAFSGLSDETKPEEGTFGYAAAAQLEAMISQGMAQGIFRKVNLTLAGKSVWASVHGLTTLLIQLPQMPAGLTHENDVSRAEMITFHIDCLWRSLASEGD